LILSEGKDGDSDLEEMTSDHLTIGSAYRQDRVNASQEMGQVVALFRLLNVDEITRLL
jgi:hypothetical protein